MEITGTLKVKFEAQQVSEKFKKRDFVVTDNSTQYPQHIIIQLTQDKCGLIDSYNEGDDVKVYVNLRGREWTSPQGEIKYFNTIEAWKIESAGSGSKPSSNSESRSNSNSGSRPASSNNTPAENTSSAFVDSDDDMPF